MNKTFPNTDATQAEFLALEAQMKALIKRFNFESKELEPYRLIEKAIPISLEDGVLTLLFSGGRYYCPCCNSTELGSMAQLGVKLIRARHPRHLKISEDFSLDFGLVEAVYQSHGCLRKRVEKDHPYPVTQGDLPQIPGVLEWELYDLPSESGNDPTLSPEPLAAHPSLSSDDLGPHTSDQTRIPSTGSRISWSGKRGYPLQSFTKSLLLVRR